MTANIPFYEGKRLDPKYNKAIPEDLDPYLPDDRLVQAVKLAQILNRPLLVKGEPGCGKTRLAEAVAYELFGDGYKNYYFEWPVKSASKAQEGLYLINHLKRLHNASLNDETISLDITLPKGDPKSDYLEFGPLGKAFRLTNTMEKTLPPPVVLIDEIDKADIDFPNDLLLELDQLKFQIPETNDGTGKPIEITANKEKKPLIIITSNDEKPLPAAFLRRCLFHYIDYPKADMLQRIVKARFPGLTKKMAAKATVQFDVLRKKIEAAGTATKNISTSELLDWVKIIFHYQTEEKKRFNFTAVNYEQALAKDVETMQIFMKYNKEKKEEAEKAAKEKAEKEKLKNEAVTR